MIPYFQSAVAQVLQLRSKQAICVLQCATNLLLCLFCAPSFAETHHFSLHAPNAKQVYLAGEMTDWEAGKRPLSQDTNGTWRLSVDLGRGQWLYKFIVDGEWIADPANPQHDSDGRGGQHSFVFSQAGPWQEDASIPHGLVESFQVPSKAWGAPNKVHVYLPPGFVKNSQLPVLLLLHGRGLDADNFVKTGFIHHYMDNLIAQKKIKPFVVVMPSSGSVPYIEQSEIFLTEELPQWFAEQYGLPPGREQFAVAGTSMGGFGAFHLPFAHTQQFGMGYALSGYFPPEEIQNLRKRSALGFRFFMRCGSEDELIQSNRDLVKALREQNLPFSYRADAGGHTWQYWSNRMEEMLVITSQFFSE